MKILEEGAIPDGVKSIRWTSMREGWGSGPDVVVALEQQRDGRWEFVASATFQRAEYRSARTGQVLPAMLAAPINGTRYRVVAEGLD